MGIGSWLVALAGPIARRVLLSLGLGVVTYVGLDLALSAALSSAKSSLGALPADIAALLAIAGVNTAASILAGALTARVAMIALKRFEPA